MSCMAGGGVRYDWAGSSEAEEAKTRIKPALRLNCETDTLYFQRGAVRQRSSHSTLRTVGRSEDWRIMTPSDYD